LRRDHSNPFLRYAGYVFSLAGARAAGIFISFLTFPYLVRRLGVEVYGQWSYVVAICGFLNIIADPGLNVFLTQHVAARREAGFASISNVLFLRLVTSFIAAGILLAVASLQVHRNVRQLLQLYGVGILLVNLMAADHLLTALELFHARSLLTVTQQLGYAAIIFIFVRTPRDIAWLPIGILVSSAMSGFAGWILLWRRGVRLRGLQLNRWKGIVIPSLHYAASSLMSNIYHRTGHILVRWFLGDFALGIYAAAVRFVDILRGFIIVVLQVLMPRIALAAETGAGLRRLARLALTALAVIGIPLTVGLIATSHLVVPWVLGEKYLADVPLLRWMAPYLITAPAASLFCGTILFAMGRHRAYLLSTAGGALAGSLLYLTLIPVLGLRGAALALALAELVVAVIALIKIPEISGLWKNPILAVSLGSATLMLLAIKLANTYTSQTIVVVSVGACIYLMSCGWFVRKLIVERQV
jgi:polysaccharide transporter, PST family